MKEMDALNFPIKSLLFEAVFAISVVGSNDLIPNLSKFAFEIIEMSDANCKLIVVLLI